MSHSRLAEIARQFVVEPEVAPAAVVAVAWRGARGWESADGAAFADRADDTGVGSSALFDLASITKPFVALTVARLARRGRLGLDAPLGELLAEASGTTTGTASLLLLLSHRAGLEGHRTLFAPLLAGLPFERARAIAEIVRGRRPECSAAAPAVGHPPIYSDLGYALVGLAVERLEGLPLDQIVDREVCAPLGLEVGSARLLRSRYSDFAERCMPTETVPFRNGEVRGVVHDENAWALSGHALSGHAGLFGTALGVAHLGRALLDVFHGRSEAWLDAHSLTPLLKERVGRDAARRLRRQVGRTSLRPDRWRECAASVTWVLRARASGAIRMPTEPWCCSAIGSAPRGTIHGFGPRALWSMMRFLAFKPENTRFRKGRELRLWPARKGSLGGA